MLITVSVRRFYAPFCTDSVRQRLSIRIRTQKTKTQATLPLSDEALSYCGDQGRGMVFKGLSRAHTHEPFKKWLKDAGIKKKITFHAYATPPLLC